MKISYVYFTENDNECGVGHVICEEREKAVEVVEKIVRTTTEERYIAFFSEKKDFEEEAKEYVFLEDYINNLIYSMNKEQEESEEGLENE